VTPLAGRFTGIVLLTALVGTSPASVAQELQPPPRDAGGYRAPTAALERGRAVYVLNHCHFCHGDDLTRAAMGAANLSQSPLVGADTDGSAIGPIVRAGLPNLQTAMPSYRELTEQEIVDLARYIHYLRQQARFNYLMTPAATPGDAGRGAEFFSGLGSCGECHTGSRELQSAVRNYEAATLRRRLLRPGPPRPVEGVEPTAGQSAHLRLLENYTLETVEALLAYLRSLD